MLFPPELEFRPQAPAALSSNQVPVGEDLQLEHKQQIQKLTQLFLLVSSTVPGLTHLAFHHTETETGKEGEREFLTIAKEHVGNGTEGIASYIRP